MKHHRAFFHTFHLSWPRFLLPLGLLLLFVVTSYSLLRHQEATAIIKFSPSLVVIDPGHGGYDPGVKTETYSEAEIALQIANQLRDSLTARGIPSTLTRETDTDYAERGMKGKTAKRTDLNKRLDITNEDRSLVFVSLHLNNSTLATRGGAEVFYAEKTPGAKEFAEMIQSELVKLPQMSKRAAKPADYYLLNNQDRPAVIVECGYLNIPDERARLMSSSYQKKLADAIATAIEQYLKKTEGSP